MLLPYLQMIVDCIKCYQRTVFMFVVCYALCNYRPSSCWIYSVPRCARAPLQPCQNVKREQVQTPIWWVYYTTFCVGTTGFLFHFPWPPIVVNHDIFTMFVQVVHRCSPFEDLESWLCQEIHMRDWARPYVYLSAFSD